jgi:hypothetical protein
MKNGTPDYPFSLYEGLVGELFFYMDILDPEKSYFPGYEI